MNFKSKAVGLVAAGIVGFSAFTGTALAETTTATLNANPNGVCSAAATASDVNFGTYQWDSDLGAYVVVTPSSLEFDVSSTYGPGTTCDVNIAASQLDRVGGGDSISVDDIVLDNLAGAGTLHSPTYPGYNPTVVEGGLGHYSSTIYLNGLFGTNYDVGVYKGTLTFTAVQAAP